MRQCKDKGHISHPQEKPQSTSTAGRGGRGSRWVHYIGGGGGGLAKPGSYICIFTCIYVYIYIYTYTHIARIDVHNSGQGAKKLAILRRGFGKKATPSYRSIPRFQKNDSPEWQLQKWNLKLWPAFFWWLMR